MKAIAVLRHPSDCVETAPRMQLIADSAMVGAGRPLFLPDFPQSWRARSGVLLPDLGAWRGFTCGVVVGLLAWLILFREV